MAQEINNSVSDMSCAALAFLGDSVYELKIRSMVVNTCEGNADELNRKAKALTNARAQARIIDYLQNYLTDEEMHVYKRGRNFKSVSAPKSCTISEYRRATGLEALMGYLFENERNDRIDELIIKGLEIFHN